MDELKDATKHFSFKAYEESFVKLEEELRLSFENTENLKQQILSDKAKQE